MRRQAARASEALAPALAPAGALALALAALSCTPAAAGPPSSSSLSSPSASLGEASALVALGGGRFLVADDERGVLLVDPTAAGAPRLVVVLEDIEGLASVPAVPGAAARFAAVAEASGVVTAFTLEGTTGPASTGASTTTVLGTLAHPPPAAGAKAKKNKGWEGIAFLSAALAFDGQAHLVAVHEGAPKAVVLFAWPSLATERVFVLEGALDDALLDLSDVSVDPKTGALLLVSDESRRIVHVTLSGAALASAQLQGGRAIELPVAKDEKPEGVAVDDAGALWIVTDATGRLLRVPQTP